MSKELDMALYRDLWKLYKPLRGKLIVTKSDIIELGENVQKLFKENVRNNDNLS